MKVSVGSLFRNSTGYFPRYLAQMKRLHDALYERGDTMRCVWVEGDSKDETWETLFYSLDENMLGRLLVCNHGGPEWGSIVDNNRMASLGKVGNVLMENIDDDTDVFVYIESDLIWDVKTILNLIDESAEMQVALSPLIRRRNGLFYDIWAFRRNGEHFNSVPPYHDSLSDGDIVELDSAGSCIVMPIEAAKVGRFTENAIVGLCKTLRENEWHICVDGRLSVTHP